MANKTKTGLDYFPMEIALLDDIKIRKLVKYHGGQAAWVYTQLLSAIYKEGYYIKWDNDLPFIISERVGFEEDYVKKVIQYCLEVGLFSKELYEKDSILTSKGIQERYDLICRQSKRRYKVSEYSLITPEEIVIDAEEIAIDTEELPQSKVKESKENKTKEKESKALTLSACAHVLTSTEIYTQQVLQGDDTEFNHLFGSEYPGMEPPLLAVTGHEKSMYSRRWESQNHFHKSLLQYLRTFINNPRNYDNKNYSTPKEKPLTGRLTQSELEKFFERKLTPDELAAF